MGRIIAVANQKGGVGKTTTTINLGAALAALDRRVLLIDLDPQECLATALKVPPPLPGQSLAEVLLDDVPLSAVLVRAHALSIAPAGADLAEAEARLLSEIGRDALLRAALEPVREQFDFILIDCPPSLGLLTLNALAAASEVLIPTQTEFLALRRLAAILRTIEKVRRRLNPSLRVLGIVPTLYDARTLHAREVLEQIRSALASEYRIFPPIPRSVRFAEASVAGEPIFSYAGEVEGAKLYRSLAEEIQG
jgi:chromosome partitioning protein